MKPSLLLLFVQPDKMILEGSTNVKEIYFLTIFGKKYMRKNPAESKLAWKPIIYIHYLD